MRINDRDVPVTRTTVTLTWEQVDGVAGYIVGRGLPRQAIEWIGTVPGTVNGRAARRFIDGGLEPATTYTYEIRTLGITPEESDRLGVTTEPETEFATPIEFFTEILAPAFARDVDQTTLWAWCPEWWRHREASVVVNELWRSYEAHRPPDDPTDPSNERAYWLTTIAYPLMEKLWNPKGVFKRCDMTETDPAERHGGVLASLPMTPDPTGSYATD